MAPIWDPRALLDIYPQRSGFKCVGTTKRGTRCGQSMFSGADMSEASQILDVIASLQPASRAVSTKLPELAGLTLCPRWHRKPGYCQVTQMVQKWQRAINNYCDSITITTPIIASARYPGSVSSVSAGLSRSGRPERPSWPSSITVIDDPPTPSAPRRSTVRPRRPTVSSTPPASPERSPAFPVATVPRTPTNSSAPSQLPTPPTTPTRSRNSSSAATSPTDSVSSSPTRSHHASSTATSPTDSVSSSPTRSHHASSTATSPTDSVSSSPTRSHHVSSTATSPTDSVSSPTRQNNVNATDPLPPSTPAPPAPVLTPCPSPHRSVKRKPITENCCVCLEPICCPDEAVWCRAQCGQNIHRECFGTWRRLSLQQARERRMDYGGDAEDSLAAVNCVFCRQRWKWEWEE